MTEPVRILHLSDFHFDGDTQWDADPVRNGLATDIRSLVQDGLVPDFVAVTGDIANKGKLEDYNHAVAWFEEELFPALGGFDVKNLLLVWLIRLTPVP